MADEKYLPNQAVHPVDEILRRIDALEKLVSDQDRAYRNQDTPPPLSRINPLTYPSPYEGQRAIDINDEQHTWYSDGEWRKAAAGGLAMYEIKVFEDPNIVIVGDGAFYWPIPDDLADSDIVYVDAGVSSASSSGPVEIQVAHQVNGAGAFTDVLSTKVSIAAGNLNATPGTVSGGLWGITNGDWLRIDIDAAGSGAKGLAVMLGITPSPLAAITIASEQGPPGGVTAWTGAWNSGTTYTTGQAVSNGGTSYVAIQGSTNVEPGVTPGWEAYWMVLSERQDISQMVVALNGNGYPLDPQGVPPRYPIFFDCILEEVMLTADRAGSIVIDIWKDTYGAYPPTVGDSICGGNKPTLSNATKTDDTTLTGWTKTLTAGDVLVFHVDSCSIITWLALALKVRRI